MPYAEANEARIYYETHGRCQPVVFVHGGGGNTLSWFNQVPEFAKRYRVITVDLRGFKNSSCAPDAVHPKHFPDDMKAVLDAEGVRAAAFVCQSLGAWAGLPLAARHPDRVTCLVLTGSPTPAYSDENWQVLRESGERFMNRASVATSFLPEHFVTRHPGLAFLYDQIRQLNGPFDARRMQDESVRLYPKDFDGFRVPTLMMGGSLDFFLTPNSHRHVATLIPGAELYDFPNAGHSAYFEEPEHFNRVVGTFLARHCPV